MNVLSSVCRHSSRLFTARASLSLTALVLSLALVAPAAATDISGKVQLLSKLSARKVGKPRADTAMGMEASEVPPPSEGEIENVVIYLEGPGLSCTPVLKRTPETSIEQHHKEFLPHVLPVTRGSKVFFENKDAFVHHVYSVSEPGPFELERFTGVRSQAFNKPGVVEIFCGIHTRMNAYILVLKNDSYAKAGKDGTFRITAVPPGNYTLHTWHPRLDREKTQAVTVPPSGTLKLDLSI
jgi:plastocyanin